MRSAALCCSPSRSGFSLRQFELDRVQAWARTLDSPATTLGSPLVSPGFVGCYSRSAPARGLPSLLDRTRVSPPQNMRAFAVARRIHHHMEDGDEPRQDTRSVWGRGYPSRRRRMHHRTYYGNRARIRLRRRRGQCLELWRKEPRSKRFSYRSPPFER